DGAVEVGNTYQLSQPPVIYRILLFVCRHKALCTVKPEVASSSLVGPAEENTKYLSKKPRFLAGLFSIKPYQK
ncbi:MAG: hypothetical protein QF453_04735, partial [Candidatus Marinimicrobia bacterium]|nr:hypothetical protein [Candidatus Neomarinimicrobiota bacterium]